LEPFDTTLDSPIARIRDLRARAPGAVVAVAGMSELQREAYVGTVTEDRLLELASSAACPDLFIISGSAGSGKSALIDRLEGLQPGLFGRVVQDATHSDSPSDTQSDLLEEFFAPYCDSAKHRPEKPRIIAANIGLLLAFFADLHKAGPHELTSLEAILNYRLGLTTEAKPELELPWTVAVVNLDLRPTAGQGGLLGEMLPLIDFENPDGIVQGAPRCDTCTVRAWCPVRSNALIASRGGREAIDMIAARAATERGRHDDPRHLWDLIARMVCGDDPFDADEDPCQAVAAAAAREDHAWLWERLLPRKLFGLGGELGQRVGVLDPSLQPTAAAHRILASAGITLPADAAMIAELEPSAEALGTAADHVRAGGVPPAELGRALIACGYLDGPQAWEPGDQIARDFGELLGEYERFSQKGGGAFPALEALRELLGRAIGQSFGVLEGDRPYVPVQAYDPRDPSRIFVDASLSYDDGTYTLEADPAVRRDGEGARLAGHRPLAVTATLGGVEVTINLPVYRLLRRAEAGTVASTSDLERFYGLRRAVEALARTAGGLGRGIVIERPEGARRYTVRRAKGLGGQDTISVQELRG
jgi:hypothetical protein